MVFLIDNDYVLDKTILDKNLLSANIKPSMILAQKINVNTLLGDKLLNKIYTDIENNSLSGNYKYLVDEYLVDVVTYYTLYYALTNLLSKIGNRGLQTESTENSTQADLSIYRELKMTYRDNCQFFEQRANKFLFLNRNLFPEYELCSSDGSMSANPDSKFFGGLVI
jgi:hypothetical protein